MAILLLVGCSYVPMPTNEPVDPPEDNTRFVRAIGAWADMLDTNLGELPIVLWFEGPCLDYGPDFYGGLCVNAATWAEHGEIHLIAPTSSSVIAHETLHLSLYRARGNGDSNHADPLWGLLQDVAGQL